MPLPYLAKSIQNKISVLLLLLLWGPLISAQQTQSPVTSVIALLKKTEKEFNVRFSYNRRDLRSLECSASSIEASLELTLKSLEQHCNLDFYRIDTRYIAVRLSSDPIVTICGTLIDTATGEPLAGASVVAPNFQGSTGSGGNFTVPAISEQETISIYHLGFKVKTVIAKDLNSADGCPLIFTDEKFNFLPTVLLNSYLTRGITKNAEGSVSISNSNFEILPSLIEPDVLRIAQILPGIESFDESASNINIRGGKSDEVLLLWDDIRMYQSGHFFGLISAFNPNLTQNVTIYKNGTHPRFGESVSGVVSMTSDSEIPENVKGAAAIDFISAQFYAKIPASEKLALHVSGRTSINTGIGNPVYKQFFDRVFQNTVVTNVETNTVEGLRSTNEAFNFYDINLKGIWQLSNKDRIQYNFLTIFNKLEFIERFTGETTFSKNESELKQRTLVNGLNWERDWSNSLSSKVALNGVNYVNAGGNQNVDTGALQSQRNEVNERQVKLDLQYSVSSDLSLNTGYQYTDTEIVNTDTEFESNLLSTQRKVLFSNAYFLNSKLKLFEKNTVVTTGIRFTSYPNIDEQFFEPRINLFQKLTTHLSLAANAEFKHQAIIQTSQVRNNILGVETKPWIILDSPGNPILESKQISLSGTFKKNQWNLSAEAFLKEVDHINSANQGFRNQLIDIRSIGSYNVSGLEVSLSKKTEHLNTWISYTFMQNEYAFENLTPSNFRNNYDVKHAVSLAASYSWKSLLFSLGAKYHSGIPFTKPIEGNEVVLVDGEPEINYSEVNSNVLREFFRTDFSASYTRQLDKTFSGKLSVSLLNIFDRRNALDRYYVLEYDQNGDPILNQIEQFSLGFTPNISLQLLF